MSNEINALAAALEAAIPQFKASADILAKYPGRENAFSWFHHDLLGENFSIYTRWKHLSDFGLEKLNQLTLIKAANIQLSLDERFDTPLTEEEEAEYESEGDYFYPPLNRQLNEKGLQLFELGWFHENGQIEGIENPFFICVITDEEKVKILNNCMKTIGLTLIR